MEINIKSNDVKTKVIEALEQKTPLFMLRMGDGEMILAKNQTDKIDGFCYGQIGRKITKEELFETQINFSKCVSSADILGLPTKKHRQLNHLWDYTLKYYDEIRNKSNDDWVNKKYCSIDLHFEMLQTGDLYEIFKKINKIVIISPRDIVDKIKNKFPNIKEVEYYSLPAEQKYEIIKNKEIDVFERIKEIIININRKERNGELLIFGAGPFGKILGYEFKNKGGVSLDMGSVFDTFVGKITRGKNKGPNSKKEPLL